ncbi:unnamed protein product [Oppiella nova]|uniref:Uncharacterized protein n=1 Tax=Oppiella nova TaxID=334625 RepID=A0A7R9LCA4_9ACAR|nr:unnamed protein product [Oppiella nova]CAG2161978.1 unnamed protein product [Oppiella nova]
MAVDETNSNGSSPKTEEEYADRITRLQMEYLIPLKEDLSDTDDITADNFMSRLDNGVIVCKLAKLIQDNCDATQQAFNGKLSRALEEEIPINGVNYKGLIRHTLAPTTTKCWENAKSQSFYARDNVSNFLKWCRKFGVRDAVLFESKLLLSDFHYTNSEDLVSHVNPRNVVLCLLEIARIACTKHSFSPAPGLVQFEQEIDELENETIDGWSVSSLSNDCNISYRGEVTAAGAVNGNGNGRMASVSSLNSSSSSSTISTNTSTTPTKLTSELDHKLLKARHVMVRVGGGWTTLSHFLERHGGDPNQEISAADLLPLDTRAISVSPRRRSYAPLVSTTAQTPPIPNTPTFGRYVSSTPSAITDDYHSPTPALLYGDVMPSTCSHTQGVHRCYQCPPNGQLIDRHSITTYSANI